MRAPQSGQALVGAMVVMVILFALAGAVAVAASGLLRQQAATTRAYTDDFGAQSATADAISQVAGTATRCAMPTTTATYARLNGAVPTPLAISFPSGMANLTSIAYCARIDQVSTTIGSNFSTDVQWQTSCPATLVPSAISGQRVETFFAARWTAPGFVYVDRSQACNTRWAASTPCQGQSSIPGCVACGATMAPAAQVTMIQLALDCDLTGATAGWYVHISNQERSPSRIFIVRHDASGGSIYLIAAATRADGAGPYEQSILLVPPAGGTNRLLWEAPL